ncbi:hypothetical protein RBH29_16585 [Herbivorax sp. ANBcel31]|uniref:hypothetical protein n=1 Tax=Herbivorax sp. ANBcel31 TaxID=3069754 RepID=UPI0027B865D9|nr:hypothetical protein [Herbivorax sp. ANBcel31]MDQ2088046.1 hypothetical protein [Herbivorax sp. ANBcel31]
MLAGKLIFNQLKLMYYLVTEYFGLLHIYIEFERNGIVYMTDMDMQMLIELDKLEKLSVIYSHEMRYISKRIRRDIWILGENSRKLAFFLNKITKEFEFIKDNNGTDNSFTLNTVIEYVGELSKYGIFYNYKLGIRYFKELINDIQLESAANLIEQQWEDVFKKEDGYKGFLEIFDDIFTKCINLHKDKFFRKLKCSDILCRVVEGTGHNADRFIPWPSKTNNRWNPPGKQYLYLSYNDKKMQYNDYLSLNEYICLKEYRASIGGKYSFCNFEPVTEGDILDLSYNDVSLSQIKSIIDDYYNNSFKKIVGDLLLNSNAYEKYKNKKRLKKDLKVFIDKNPVDKSIIEESYAKQYLKMICNCVYKKVDEKDEDKREKVYKSFHVLSKYLESKGVTGIIYPCTRTKKIIGKNLVLFNVKDARPIMSSIREYIYV